MIYNLSKTQRADKRCYTSIGSVALFLICLWRRTDSNRRPLGYEPNELPTALPRYVKNQQSRPTHSCINRLCGSVVNNLFYLSRLNVAICMCFSSRHRLQNRYKSPLPTTSSYLASILPQSGHLITSFISAKL